MSINGRILSALAEVKTESQGQLRSNDVLGSISYAAIAKIAIRAGAPRPTDNPMTSLSLVPLEWLDEDDESAEAVGT